MKKYNNVIECILGEFYNVEKNYNPKTMELFFDDDEKELERKTINNLGACYYDCFVFVYQGIKNSQHWYKIYIKDITQLTKDYSYKF